MIRFNSALKKNLGKALATAMLGAFAFTASTSTVDAKRIHDPQVETKSESRYLSANTTKNVSKSRKKSREELKEQRATLQQRVQAILNPVADDQNFPFGHEHHLEYGEEEFFVPTTLSSSDPSIIGTPMASQTQCVRYLLRNNPNPNIAVTAEEIVQLYYEEGEREGIRPDVALCQAFKETGFFRYGGTVTPDQNNFCGLGTTSATVKGSYFPNPQIGVRAHIQHLLAYSSTRKPTLPVVDPRYSLVRNAYGQRTLGNWQDLNGRWAVPGDSYGQSILSMFNAMLRQ